MNGRALPEFIDRQKLIRLITAILDIADERLKKRGFGEERFLSTLYERAVHLESPALRMVEGLEAGNDMGDYIRDYASLSGTLNFRKDKAC